MKRIWDKFWYKWHYPEQIVFGGGPQGYKTFKKQQLFNVIIVLIALGILLYIILD